MFFNLSLKTASVSSAENEWGSWESSALKEASAPPELLSEILEAK